MAAIRFGDAIEKKDMNRATTYLSDSRPAFEPQELIAGKSRRIATGTLPPNSAPGPSPRRGGRHAGDMLVIRELEEMIVKLRSGAYEPLRGYNYRGPTTFRSSGRHCGRRVRRAAIGRQHHKHHRATAKVWQRTVAIRQMSDEQLRRRVPQCPSAQARRFDRGGP